jgi:hypothetical protein
MFKHLPVITDDNYDVLLEKEISAISERINCTQQGVIDLREVTDYACREFEDSNPKLVDVIYDCVWAVTQCLEHEGATPEAANFAGVICLMNILPLLRVIDRSLEAQELERKFKL